MIQSMTGYGKGERTAAGKKIVVEIRSLNGKQLDLSVKLPSLYREREHDIRTEAARTLVRGKVDIYINVELISARKSYPINAEAFKDYYEQLRSLADELSINPEGESLMQSVLRLPDVLQASETVVVSDDEWAALLEAVAEALANISAFRSQEGAVLIADLLGRVDLIESLLVDVDKYEKERIETVKTRIGEGIESLKVDIDRNRFEQELIYYIEKLDVTEEKIRLKQHCNYFREISGYEDAIGRKLGFVAQEMGREINTLGSKANHSEIQKIVVRMKDELEKIKEQLLNVL